MLLNIINLSSHSFDRGQITLWELLTGVFRIRSLSLDLSSTRYAATARRFYVLSSFTYRPSLGIRIMLLRGAFGLAALAGFAASSPFVSDLRK
jgi:hypothetical protein